MSRKIKYAAPAVTRLGKVERRTELLKQHGPKDLVGNHRLID